MNMKYQFREAGEAVFYQGDHGEEYFIILKGRVQISVVEIDTSQCHTINCGQHRENI